MTRSSSSLDAPPALTGGAAAAALPALADFDFPVAVVVSDLGADGSVCTILEAGEVDEVLPFASVTKPIVAWSALVAADRGLLDLDAPARAGTARVGPGAGGAWLSGARRLSCSWGAASLRRFGMGGVRGRGVKDMRRSAGSSASATRRVGWAGRTG